MRRTLHAVALLAGLAVITSSARAGDSTIGGDLNWPTVSVIDDTTPQTAPVPKNQTDAIGRRVPTAGTTSSTGQQRSSPQATSGGNQSSPAQNASGSQDDRDRQASRRVSARGDEDLNPPIPERRGTQAVAPQPAVASVISLAQTVTPAEAEDKLGKIVGQMIMIGFDGTAPGEEWPKRIVAQLEAGQIGGVVFADRNFRSPDQLKTLVSEFRKAKAPFRPLLAVAQEGGAAHCLPADKGFRAYPSAGELGRQNDPLNAYGVYQAMAEELVSLGFNVNLGPVLDLAPENAAANDRDYGSQPKHVAAFAKAFRLAHTEAGIFTVLKHFPGQLSNGSWDKSALEPYKQLTANGNVDMVMVGQAAHNDFSDEPGLAASLSQNAIQRRLRGDIGYRGVVISGDLEGLEAAQHSPAESLAVRAFVAGNDMVIVGNHLKPVEDLPAKILAAVKEAVMSGTLTQERIEASFKRIIAVKERLGVPGRALAAAVAPDMTGAQSAAHR